MICKVGVCYGFSKGERYQTAPWVTVIFAMQPLLHMCRLHLVLQNKLMKLSWCQECWAARSTQLACQLAPGAFTNLPKVVLANFITFVIDVIKCCYFLLCK
jgi:hypothetical protein